MVNPSQKIDSSKNEFKHTRLQFPSDLGAYAMVINFIDYDYRSTFGNVRSNPIAKAGSTIVLPLPQNLEDATGVRVNSAELGASGAAAYEILNMTSAAAREGGGDVYEAARAALNKHMAGGDQDMSDALSTFRAFTKFVGRNALDSIAPGLSTAVDITTGTAVNPHTTLDFDGVTLKTHTFTWNVSPRNQRESDSLNSIIKVVKKNMLPSYKGLGDTDLLPRALLTYPKLVKISLLGVNQDYFYYFKPSMIQGFNVSYSQGDGITMLKGGRPSNMTLTMSVIEAQIHTSEDYRDFDDGRR